MKAPKTIYVCQNCGSQAAKWVGKCPDCNQWNTFAEENAVPAANDKRGQFFELTSEKPVALADISLKEHSRVTTGIDEFDRVLGGGVVPGSLILVGGDPGIGKSTLVLQTLGKLADGGVKVLYATGEESSQQIKMRAIRLGIESNVMVMAENSLERIIAQVEKLKPAILVVDSIQTVYMPQLESAPGSVSQVRESAGKLLYLSKTTGVSTVLIGHVTKDGSLAGPRVLEHMVDTVLYFEGDSRQQYRILRSIKNRYGSTNEIGVFEMGPAGLGQVTNPSALFLPDRQDLGIGSTVTAALEGLRPFLVEIQGLVSDSTLANPRRTTLGVDQARVSLLVAVLEKVVGLNLYAQDIYVNAAGGFKVTEPASDLAIVAALVSSFKNRPLKPHTLLLGEVGLSGEVRGIQGLDIRINEAEKLGFLRCILPKTGNKTLRLKTMKLIPVATVSEALEALF